MVLLQGALCVLAGVSVAGLAAFTLARTIGRPWARQVIGQEMGDGGAANALPVQASLARVPTAIEQGDFWQQCAAVTLLRLTPVVPFR